MGFPRRGALVLALAVLASITVFSAEPAYAITKSQVDAACANSRSALNDYRGAQTDFEEAALAYEATTSELERASLRESSVRSDIGLHESTVNDIRERVNRRAVEMYMQGGASNSGILMFVTNLDQFITGSQLLNAAAEDDLADIDRLSNLRQDLNRLKKDLQGTQASLREVRGAQSVARDRQESAMEDARDNYARLSGQCAKAQSDYERQLALERARRQGRSAGISSALTPGFICPMSPGATHFIDSWGFPRDGGARSHKGSDIFAPMRQPVYAVASGVAYASSSSKGGRSVWLQADYGVGFYYAHLTDWAIGSSQRVQKGDVIGYNGNTGNARGGSPHVHFEIHPGGVRAGAVNPYPTLARACK